MHAPDVHHCRVQPGALLHSSARIPKDGQHMPYANRDEYRRYHAHYMREKRRLQRAAGITLQRTDAPIARNPHVLEIVQPAPRAQSTQLAQPETAFAQHSARFTQQTPSFVVDGDAFHHVWPYAAWFATGIAAGALVRWGVDTLQARFTQFSPRNHTNAPSAAWPTPSALFSPGTQFPPVEAYAAHLSEQGQVQLAAGQHELVRRAQEQLARQQWLYSQLRRAE
jgi:hypothetical protein